MGGDQPWPLVDGTRIREVEPAGRVFQACSPSIHRAKPLACKGIGQNMLEKIAEKGDERWRECTASLTGRYELSRNRGAPWQRRDDCRPENLCGADSRHMI